MELSQDSSALHIFQKIVCSSGCFLQDHYGLSKIDYEKVLKKNYPNSLFCSLAVMSRISLGKNKEKRSNSSIKLSERGIELCVLTIFSCCDSKAYFDWHKF